MKKAVRMVKNSKLREMLDITEIKEILESIQRNKEDFSKQVNKWIEDGVAAIRDYADGKDNDFQPEAGNAVAWGIIAEAFRYGKVIYVLSVTTKFFLIIFKKNAKKAQSSMPCA